MQRTTQRTIGFVTLGFALHGCAPGAPEAERLGIDGSQLRAGDGANLVEANLVEVYVVLNGPSAVDLVSAQTPVTRWDDPSVLAAVQKRIASIEAQQQNLVPMIEALGGAVHGRFTRLGNAIQIQIPEDALRDVHALPGVLRTDPVTYFERNLQSALGIVGAPSAWAIPPGVAGSGMTIGIIDSGIDYTHADFGGDGNPATHANNDPDIIEPGTFPTAKVIGGFDFVGDAYDPASGNSPIPDLDPLDCFNLESTVVAGGHGTHVTGIAAGMGVLLDGSTFTGPYDQSLEPSLFRVAPGIAPEASLYALKVFGCNGGTNALASALERAADPNLDGNFSDRLDVVNASLGTSYGLGSGFEADLVKNLNTVGSLLVVAAGNDGNAFFAVGSPAIYPTTLAVAASADADFLAVTVDAPQNIAQDFPAAEGGFTLKLALSGPVTGTVVATQPANACSAIQNPAAIAGNIALIDRGDCFFVQKFANAEAAGAIAVVVVDDEVADAPFSMGGGDGNGSGIPGVMIRRVHGDIVKSELAGGVTMTLDGAKKFEDLGTELFASFSSRGPGAGNGDLKPEISAPGFSIDSAQVASGTEARRSQGTSMACPVVTGAAALVRQANPDYTPTEVKAALMNAAARISDADDNPYTVSMTGAGRLDAPRAVLQRVTAQVDSDDGSVGVSFGSIVTAEKTSRSQTLRVTNHDTAAINLDVRAEQTYPMDGVTLALSPETVTLAPGASETVELTLSIDPIALPQPSPDPVTPETVFDQPRHYLIEAAGLVLFEAAGVETARVPFYSSVRAAGERVAAARCGETVTESGLVELNVVGETPVVGAMTTAFQLGEVHPEKEESPTDPDAARLDIRAVGAATSYRSDESYEETSISFGIAVAGAWTTPGQGAYSPIGILIDIDEDDQADFVTFAEPLTREGPYTDTLAATTYDLQLGGQTESKRFLNIVPASDYATQPFFNDVVVLSVFARDLRISEADPVIRYQAISQTLGGTIDEATEWITFSTTQPIVDTSIGGEIPKRPIYAEDEPIKVFVDLEAANGNPLPEVLLLHHSNRAGQTWETVSLEASEPGNLSIEKTDVPASADAGEVFTSVLTIRNDAPGPATELMLTGSIADAEVVTIVPSQGDCDITADFECDLGELAPGASASLTIRARASADDTPPTAELTLSATAKGCDDDDADNSATWSVALVEDATSSLDDLRVSGGCGCRIDGATRKTSGAWGLLLGALLLVQRRRRARSLPKQLV